MPGSLSLIAGAASETAAHRKMAFISFLGLNSFECVESNSRSNGSLERLGSVCFSGDAESQNVAFDFEDAKTSRLLLLGGIVDEVDCRRLPTRIGEVAAIVAAGRT